jgi:hypothetical protein
MTIPREPRCYPYSTACTMARDLVQRAGFLFLHNSANSGAAYFGWPGRFGTLRVTALPKDGPPNKRVVDGPTLVSAIFPKERTRGFTVTEIEAEAARAIGIYMIRARRVGQTA